MITTAVTPKQLREWKRIYAEKAADMQPNRISGAQLEEYFVRKYQPQPYSDADFAQVVSDNASYCGELIDDAAEMRCYRTSEGVLVGIELLSGAFHVESSDTLQMAAVYDDLFYVRGLSGADLQNYVITAQYILLREKRTEE